METIKEQKIKEVVLTSFIAINKRIAHSLYQEMGESFANPMAYPKFFEKLLLIKWQHYARLN